MTVTATIQGGNTMLTAWEGTEPKAVLGMLDIDGALVAHGLESGGCPAAVLALVRAGIDLAHRQKKDVYFTVDPDSPQFQKLHRLYTRIGGVPVSIKYRFRSWDS